MSAETMTKIDNLVVSLAELASAMQTVKSSKSIITRPSSFKGSSENARPFLAQFTNWANGQKELWNGENKIDKAWIGTFLSFMEGAAANWALPYLNKLQAHLEDDSKEYPFETKNDLDQKEVLWTTCVEAFKQRFLPADEKSEARRQLQMLKQTKGVAEYASLFQEIAARTGFSDTDLMERFYIGLKEQIKDSLMTIGMVQEPEDLKDLIRQASRIDQRFKERQGERPQFGGYKPKSTPDPYAMDIDATRPSGRVQNGNGKTHEDYQKAMYGRCYGCGSRDHVKMQGNHGGITCSYCHRRGHFQSVCQDKFLGRKPREKQAQRAAATQEKPFSLFPEEDSISSSTSHALPSEWKASLEEKMDKLQQAMKDF